MRTADRVYIELTLVLAAQRTAEGAEYNQLAQQEFELRREWLALGGGGVFWCKER